MRTTNLIAALLGVIALGIFAADASAMYHPSMGRFLSRDPGAGSAMRIGAGGAAPVGGFIRRDPTGSSQHADGMNLYQYVRSNPVAQLDPQGLFTLREAEIAITIRWKIYGLIGPNAGRVTRVDFPHDVFKQWVYMESKDMGWLTRVPECPSVIRITDGKPCDCDNGQWGSIGKASQKYHPGAKWSMRSRKFGGSGQQCNYNGSGQLITTWCLAAGTPDRKAPSWTNLWLKHFQHDVEPFNLARRLDGGVVGKHLREYLKTRPPSQGGGKCYK